MGTASDDAPFVLSRATSQDMEEMVNVLYTCFDESLRSIFMGCPTPENLPKIRARYLREMQSDHSDIWIKVVDTSTNKIIAGSNWKVFLNIPEEHKDHEVMDWQDPESQKISARIVTYMGDRRKAAMPGAYVHLHICFTAPEYRRRGAGGMMMTWGCDLMDSLFLPGWIEASPEGNFLYSRFGFYDYERIQAGDELDGTNMKRDVRKEAIVGGEHKTIS